MNQGNFDGIGPLARTGCAPFVVLLAVLVSCSIPPLTFQEAEILAHQHVNHGNSDSFTTVTQEKDETQSAYYFDVRIASRQTVIIPQRWDYHLVRVDKQRRTVESGQSARDMYAKEKPGGSLLTSRSVDPLAPK
jgi:hypothetical protein